MHSPCDVCLVKRDKRRLPRPLSAEDRESVIRQVLEDWIVNPRVGLPTPAERVVTIAVYPGQGPFTVRLCDSCAHRTLRVFHAA